MIEDDREHGHLLSGMRCGRRRLFVGRRALRRTAVPEAPVIDARQHPTASQTAPRMKRITAHHLDREAGDVAVQGEPEPEAEGPT